MRVRIFGIELDRDGVVQESKVETLEAEIDISTIYVRQIVPWIVADRGRIVLDRAIQLAQVAIRVRPIEIDMPVCRIEFFGLVVGRDRIGEAVQLAKRDALGDIGVGERLP